MLQSLWKSGRGVKGWKAESGGPGCQFSPSEYDGGDSLGVDEEEGCRLYEGCREGTGECTKVDGYAGGGACVGEEDNGDGMCGCHACDASDGDGASCDDEGSGELRADADELEDEEAEILEMLELEGDWGS